MTRSLARRTLRPRPSQGAALLVAMVLLSVVATLSAGMVWQQWKGVQVETAERSRAQTAWVLQGALDWSRLILREDARSGRSTNLNEPWATPLAEARLSTFLATDADHNTETGPEAFLAGGISDAQSRYNLRNLVIDAKVVPAQLAVLQRLCLGAGLSEGVASQVASGLLAAQAAANLTAGNNMNDNSGSSSNSSAPLPPQQMADLAWLGLDASTIERLSAVATLLPVRTALNVNTASREVLAGVITGLGLGGADRLVQQRLRAPFNDLAAVSAMLGASVTLTPGEVDVRSSYFEVRGRLRLEQRLLSEQSLVTRSGAGEVTTVQRLRQAGLSLPGR